MGNRERKLHPLRLPHSPLPITHSRFPIPVRTANATTMPYRLPVRAASRVVAATLLLTNPLLAQWTSHESGTKASLRGLSVVDAKTAWASGARGTDALH